MAPGHLGGGTRLIDEDQPLRVEIELTVEPDPATAENVGTILLRGMPGLFFSVIFRRAKKRHKVEIATPTPWPVNSSRNSAKVMSGFSSTAARITGA